MIDNPNNRKSINSWGISPIDNIKSPQRNSIAMGPFGSNIKKDNFQIKGVPVIRGNNLRNNIFEDSDFVYISDKLANQLSASSARRLDLVLTHRGTIGQVAIIPLNSKFDRYIVSQSQMKLTVDQTKCDPYFVYYFLTSKKGMSQFLSNTSQTGVPSIASPTTTLKSIIVPIPPLKEQKAIAKILFDLDSKIEHNKKMNRTLETIAQAIFKHWFIDFDFPNEEGNPYKSSGGEMVDSELGEIPSKWKIGRLIDLTLNFDSKRVPLSSREREARTGTYPYYGAASLLDFVDSYIFDGIYLLVGEDGTVIDEHGHPILQYVFGRFWVNNHAHVIQGKYPFSTEYVYLLLKQLNVKHIVTGAVQAKINQANLNSITVVMPPADLINVFNRLIEEGFSKLRLNKNEMDSLTELREILLPKLISGKIRVPLEEK